MAWRGQRESAQETVLVVDRVLPWRRWESLLASEQREVVAERSVADGINALTRLSPDLVLVSLDLTDVPGVRAIELFREQLPNVPLIAVAERANVRSTVAAMRSGAVDCVLLGEGRGRMVEAVGRALATSESAVKGNKSADEYGFTDWPTQSPRMLEVFDQIRAVAPTDATVLIRGETGTGKELVSRKIHARSARRGKPFVSVNCGAFTESLLESELWGHERGSFTGAVERHTGLFEMANNGTLFLDELGETSLSVQVNLLRVLEEMRFRRIGGREEVHIDVRIVAATNLNLDVAVARGGFREDLFYRLNVFPIFLPPLRERTVDIPLLMRHFLGEVSLAYGLEPPVVADDAWAAIMSYRWPGNVRELRSMCERWVITRTGQRLERTNLPLSMTGDVDPSKRGGTFSVDETQPLKHNVGKLVEQVERAYLYRLLKLNQGQLERTAQKAGITRRTLYNKMKRYGFRSSQFRTDQ